MPDALLVSGPAGGGKSQAVEAFLEDVGAPVAVVDFTALYVALSGDVRDPETGRYPLRKAALLPLAEYARRTAISRAAANELPIVATNASGDPERRASLLAHLATGRQPSPAEAVEIVEQAAGRDVREALRERYGPGLIQVDEVVIDPGRSTVIKRLSDATGALSDPCAGAVNRWYRKTGERPGPMTKPAGPLGPSAELQRENMRRFEAMKRAARERAGRDRGYGRRFR